MQLLLHQLMVLNTAGCCQSDKIDESEVAEVLLIEVDLRSTCGLKLIGGDRLTGWDYCGGKHQLR